MRMSKNKKSIYLNKKREILNALYESGPLTFEALSFETDIPENEMFEEVLKFVNRGWIKITNNNGKLQSDTILNTNYLR